MVADLSTASMASDIANRIMMSAAISLGRSWEDVIGAFAKALTVGIRVGVDPYSTSFRVVLGSMGFILVAAQSAINNSVTSATLRHRPGSRHA